MNQHVNICWSLSWRWSRKRQKKGKENSAYDERNQRVILSVEVIVMQARSDFESHNYPECKISRSKWIMKLQPFCIIYARHQNNINISLYDAVKLKPAATELKLQTGPRRHVTRSSFTSQRSSANFNLAPPMRTTMEVWGDNSWTNICVPLSCLCCLMTNLHRLVLL